MWDLLQYGDQGYGDELVRGALYTLMLAASSVVVGVLIGLGLASAKLAQTPAVRRTAFGFTAIFRGVPELLIMLVVYFGVGIAINKLVGLIGYESRIEVDKFAAATFALGLVFGAFSSEVFRGAFLAVPKGQIEAGLACGMSRRQIFVRIRMPQMWRFALPGLGNLWLILLKDTSLAAIITYDELAREARTAAENSGESFLLYGAAGVIYLVFTAVSMVVTGRLERWADKGVRRA
jgi:His/Glu/Gln/Arg/opine family amino acid ABC transporter permease subunit